MSLASLFKSKILLFIAVFGVTFGIGAFVGERFINQSIETRANQGKNINILFMGIDARDAKSNSRSDTMIVVSIDPKTKKIALVSIPRDTRIKVSPTRSDKINSINYTKGPEAACKEVSKLLGTRVDYYVVTNFAGFEKIVDILGGVDMYVEMDMYHPDINYTINLSKGQQHLNGRQALDYVRFRGGPTADIGRTQRQQKFIKAIADEMFTAKTIIKLPTLIPEIAKNIHTNIPVNDMLYMAKAARGFDEPGMMVAQTLPGYPYTDPKTGTSYWEVDKKVCDGIIEALLNGEKFDVVSDPPNWIKRQKKSNPTPLPELLEQETEEVLPDGENKDSSGNEVDPNLEGEGATNQNGTTEDPGNNDNQPIDNTGNSTNNQNSNNSNPTNGSGDLPQPETTTN